MLCSSWFMLYAGPPAHLPHRPIAHCMTVSAWFLLFEFPSLQNNYPFVFISSFYWLCTLFSSQDKIIISYWQSLSIEAKRGLNTIKYYWNKLWKWRYLKILIKTWWRDGSKSSRASVIRNTKQWARCKKKTGVSFNMTLSHILFGSNVDLRALNKIFLCRFLYFLYFDVSNRVTVKLA